MHEDKRWNMQLLIVVEVAETEWHLDELTDMRGSEVTRRRRVMTSPQRWVVPAERKVKEQIFGMSTLRSFASNL